MSTYISSTLDIFPNEILFQFFLQLDYSSIRSAALAYSQIENIVYSEYFWKCWFDTKFVTYNRREKMRIVREIIEEESILRLTAIKKSSKFPLDMALHIVCCDSKLAQEKKTNLSILLSFDLPDIKNVRRRLF